MARYHATSANISSHEEILADTSLRAAKYGATSAKKYETWLYLHEYPSTNCKYHATSANILSREEVLIDMLVARYGATLANNKIRDHILADTTLQKIARNGATSAIISTHGKILAWCLSANSEISCHVNKHFVTYRNTHGYLSIRPKIWCHVSKRYETWGNSRGYLIPCRNMLDATSAFLIESSYNLVLSSTREMPGCCDSMSWGELLLSRGFINSQELHPNLRKKHKKTGKIPLKAEIDLSTMGKEPIRHCDQDNTRGASNNSLSNDRILPERFP